MSLAGFQTVTRSIAIQTAIPMDLEVRLEIAGQQTTVTVEANTDNLVENRATVSDVVDRQLLVALPTSSPDSGLNDAIIYTTPGVAADSNGFFHPLGDHAQVSYVIDGQPVSDQRNKVFSTSIPANAIQSMEVISGSPPAEYGDKTSLVINASTRSGLGQKPTGSLTANYGSFGTIGEEATLGLGGARWGNFLVVNAERTGRFLDTPEFWPMHDVGNTGTLFDRVDFEPGGKDALHLDLWRPATGFRFRTRTISHTRIKGKKLSRSMLRQAINIRSIRKLLLASTLLYAGMRSTTIPAAIPWTTCLQPWRQHRSLTNFGLHADLSHVQRRHNWKAGLNAMQTRLDEAFSLGITDPAYNAPYLTDGQPNPQFLSSLLPYDLTRGGQLYQFRGKANINQFAAFLQDSITLGDLTLNLGLRFDRYDGLTRGGGLQPRGAFSYLFKPTKTVIRGGYSHTMETPTNENLVASSSTGSGGLASNLFKGTVEQRPIALGSRNQYDAGIQQGLSRWVLVDVSYFRKYTRNAFDFDALFSTPITFPIGWKQSKLDGVSARVSTIDIHGLRVYATMGHANARFFGPENGGIIFNSNLTIGAYRQDHDQVYQQNVNLHYQRAKNGWWTDFTWRYDSGLVVGAVNNLADALALTADQQSTIGLYCGDERATLAHRITTCNSPSYGAERINILAPGTENDDHNPPRTKSRHILNLGVGTDNLFHAEHIRTTVRFTVVNLTNKAALYNFLSPFSGTHWVEPRSYQAQLGWAF